MNNADPVKEWDPQARPRGGLPALPLPAKYQSQLKELALTNPDEYADVWEIMRTVARYDISTIPAPTTNPRSKPRPAVS